jgi:hypothetical protein
MTNPRNVLLAAILFSAVCAAQVQPYVGGGIGLDGAGFATPYYNGDAGVNVTLRRLFVEAEVGADSGNKLDTKDGYTVRTHGLLMLQATRRWRFGGGIHYSALTTSQYKKHDRWPVVAAMFEKSWFRGNFEYLLPGSDRGYNLNGPLIDLRFRISKGVYYRQRLVAFVYRNPFEAVPSYHTSSELDYGLIYVFRDRQKPSE